MNTRLSFRGLAALALGGVLALSSAASASPERPADARAEQQLQDVEEAGDAPLAEDPTLALLDLALALPELDGADARRARAILSRPTDGNSPYGGNWPNAAEERFVETPAFVVHYAEVPGCDVTVANCDEPDLTDDDNNGVPDYVDATVDAVNESIAVQNGQLGWPLPKGDGVEGEPSGSSAEDRFDVYISDLCDESDFSPCVFGFADPDDSSDECNSAPFRCSAHLVVDNDYNQREFGASGGELGLRVTTAHEYNHVLQFKLDSNQDSWMFESTAVWSEEHVFPDDDDWLRSYMSDWAAGSLVPVTQNVFRVYGSAVWNHWLEHGDHSFGPDVVLNAWESSRDVTPKDYAVGAYDDAIRDEGGAGFGPEFAAFTAATAEWTTGDGGFPDASELPKVRRQGKLAAGRRPLIQRLNNTSYALFRVKPRGATEIKLKGRSGGDVQWSIGLIGRDGSKTAGAVQRPIAFSGGEEKLSVNLSDVKKYERITAVVTNADGRVAGDKPIFGNFNYTRNGEDFKLKVR